MRHLVNATHPHQRPQRLPPLLSSTFRVEIVSTRRYDMRPVESGIQQGISERARYGGVSVTISFQSPLAEHRRAYAASKLIVQQRGAQVATQTVVTVTDDLDGSEAEETIRFAIDGTEFEIDLSKAHANELRGTLKPYIKAARKSGRRRAGRRRTANSDKEETKAIRDWARQQGMEVSDRGRIPAEIQQAYKQGVKLSHNRAK
jgi:hypothetical protein